ncbi:alpha/beta fold hydrolase [Muricauda sp. JGD-17]|uniref:Alpha/beta fold hydrolase n=1 Tax=Flagellimonas ochracea TaxID=2696472 RepID=A0A964WYX4_9FLAO|nr:alpha/beta fold hydrolase [Allomuricauda ochracea]NAY93069.1 alpha/beta fold hydrolase [Allomuricauda ochracea]
MQVENIREHHDLVYYEGKDADSVKHKLNLFLPEDVENPPILIWIHGGAWAFGGRKFETDLARAFASDGIAVAAISYRLSPGTWKNPKFDEGVQHPEHIKDVARAFSWVYKNAKSFDYDQNSIFVSGYSAGGHLSALLAMDPSYLSEVRRSVREIKGAIPIAGAYDIAAYHESHLRYNGRDMAEKHVQAVFGNTPKQFKNASPTFYIENQWIPMLVISEKDTYGYTQLLEHAASQANYKTMDFYHAKDMNHGQLLRDLAKPKNSKYRSLIVDYIQKNQADYSYLEMKDINLAYKIFGQGEPLFILNGGPGFSSHNFVSLAQKFSKNHLVVLFDQRGTGFSKLAEPNEDNVTMSAMVEDMEAIRRHLGLREITLFGQSFGGIYAMSYAAKYPEHVKGMILSHSGGMNMDFLNTVDKRLTSNLEETDRIALAELDEVQNPDLRSMKQSKALAGGYLFYKKNKDKVFRGLAFNSRYHPRINQLLWADLRETNYDVVDTMKQFTKPVLIIHGENDIVDPKHAVFMHAIFPNSTFELLKNCAHYGWLDAPGEYFKAIDDFFKKNG